MAGCVYAQVENGHKGKAQSLCRDKAKKHTKEVIERIVFK